MRRAATAGAIGAAVGAAASTVRRPGVAARAKAAVSRVVEQVRDTAASVVGSGSGNGGNGGNGDSGNSGTGSGYNNNGPL